VICIASGASIIGGKEAGVIEPVVHLPEIGCARDNIVARVVRI
jgi:hypothetical protein